MESDNNVGQATAAGATAGAVAAPAGGGASPPGSVPKPLRKAIAEFFRLIPVVGRPVAHVIDEGDWKLLAILSALLWFFAIYPLLVPLIAASLINSGVLMGQHENYAAAVRSAFRVREAADEVNKEVNSRLDYFYAIEFTGHPRDTRTYEMPVLPLQRMELKVEPGNLLSRDPGCEIQKEFNGKGAELMQVRAGGQKLLSVTNQGAAESVSLTAEDWTKMMGYSSGGRLRITFEPVKGLREGCDALEVEVRATVMVFKELLKKPKEGQ